MMKWEVRIGDKIKRWSESQIKARFNRNRAEGWRADPPAQEGQHTAFTWRRGERSKTYRIKEMQP